MLSKDDLQHVRGIVREEVGNETQSVKDEVLSELRMSRMRIQKDIDDVFNRVKNLEIRLAKMNNQEVEEVDPF